MNTDQLKTIRNQDYLSVEDISEAFNLSKRAVRKWREDGKIKDEFIKKEVSPGGQGFRYLYNAFGIPEPYRSTYIREYLSTDDELFQKHVDAIAFSEAPDFKKQHANKWLNWIQMFGHLRGADLEAAISAYKKANPKARLSLKNFYRKEKAFRKQGLSALLPDYGNRAGASKVRDEDFELFKDRYLTQSRPTPESCWDIVRGLAYKERGVVSNFPSARTFMYRLEKEIPESTIYFYRYGQDAWKRKYAYSVNRDKSEIPANSCWVGDHRLLDIFVVNEKTGNVFRPWCTAWMDFKTNKFIQAHVYEGYPNSDRIIQSLKWGIEEFGRPYDSIYIDNGKDYRSKDFAGGRSNIDEAQTRTIISMLGIEAHFALPYNAQAKNIERAFRQFIEWMEKHLIGYSGNKAYNRPDDTNERVKDGKLLPFSQFKQMFEDFVFQKVNKTPSQGKELKGRTPDEAFYAEYNKKIAVRPEALHLMCMRSSNDVKIGPNGVRDSELGKIYYGDWMDAHKGTKVYLRRDIKSYQEAWVHNAKTGALMGIAYLSEAVSGWAKTDIEKEKLKQVQKRKQREIKMHKKFRAKVQLSPQEVMDGILYSAKATEQERIEKGDFIPYSEDVPVIEMDTTKMDEYIRDKEALVNPVDPDLSLIAPNKPKITPLKEIWDDVQDTDATAKKTGTDDNEGE